MGTKRPKALHPDSALIEKAGGPSALARLCEVSPQAVSQWATDGIPRARMMYLRLVMPDVFTAPAEAAKAAA